MESVKFNENFIDPKTGSRDALYGKKLLEKVGEKYISRGNAYSELGNYKQAIKDYSKAIAHNPKYALPYLNRGLAYYKLGKYKDAIKDFDKAIELNTYDDDFYYSRGHA
ncbi:MAG: tetratricopeptide repeat protein [Candidatus Omnitrophica bacterium]|nr:tetratricopeptide repeat protein [Candidatus Omnitrophota bacterium]